MQRRGVGVPLFLLAIQDKRVISDQEDKLLMREAIDVHFSVKLLYRAMD